MCRTQCCNKLIRTIRTTPWITIAAFILSLFAIFWGLRDWTYQYWHLLHRPGLAGFFSNLVGLTPDEALRFWGNPYPFFAGAVVCTAIAFLVVLGIKACGRYRCKSRGKHLRQAVKAGEKVIVQVQEIKDIQYEAAEIQKRLTDLTSRIDRLI
jgi:hypothetical protein